MTIAISPSPYVQCSTKKCSWFDTRRLLPRRWQILGQNLASVIGITRKMYLGYRHSYPSREKRIVRTNLPERRFSAHDKNLLVSFDQKMDDAFRPCRVPPRGSIQVKRLYSKSLPFHFSSLPFFVSPRKSCRCPFVSAKSNALCSIPSFTIANQPRKECTSPFTVSF